eukprot:7365251-Prymnesium_polylepis.2
MNVSPLRGRSLYRTTYAHRYATSPQHHPAPAPGTSRTVNLNVESLKDVRKRETLLAPEARQGWPERGRGPARANLAKKHI